jgi:predicted TIM-barrel fold metal-dependent hydrolase
MRRIAVEEHFIMPGARDYASAAQARRGYEVAATKFAEGVLDAFALGESRIAEMDANGIDVMVLSHASVEGSTNLDGDAASAFCERVNDYLAEQIQAYPDRLAGFASLPLEDPRAAVEELERAVTKLGFKGALVSGHIHGDYLDDPRFWCVWEALEALDVPLYLHPAHPDVANIKMADGYPMLLGPAWGFTVDTAAHTLRVIAGGVFDAFPRATLMLGHLGESLPYQLHRLDQGWEPSRRNDEPPGKKLNKRFSQYVKDNIVITTSGNHSHAALTCAIAALGVDRILFAADFPFVALDEMVEFMETAPLTDGDRTSIYSGNAERLLRM